MCLFPRLIINKKYSGTKKNNFNPPILTDERIKFVPIGCGRCIECLKQKARNWQVRLYEEIRDTNTDDIKFVTLTFSPEKLDKLCKETNLNECNAIGGIAVRRFLERWRKMYKKSVRHWLITELGHENTERIHLHGLLFTNKDDETIAKIWKYGNIFVGKDISNRTINYIMKYVTKIDQQHKNFIGQIFCSKGIGKKYLSKLDATENKYKPNQTKEFYKTTTGHKIALPMYYRNNIYTEDEREKLWLEKLDKQIIYVLKNKIDISTIEGQQKYLNILADAQQKNNVLGFGNSSNEWKKKDYNVTLNMLNKLTNNKKLQNNKVLFYKELENKVKKKELKTLKKLQNNK